MKERFEIILASHYGMCFGVRDALEASEQVLAERRATILGQLVHNESVRTRLAAQGALEGDLRAAAAPTRDVIVTAHGAADRDRARWRREGYRVTDTTCPLVHRAHAALAHLAEEGCMPVVIGKRDHVEVMGLTGDFPGSHVVLSGGDVEALPFAEKIGVVAQTTQPIERVLRMVEKIRQRHPAAEVVFRDTVCRPTKERQEALDGLCRVSDLVLAVGGRESNNTWQLVRKARQLGCRAERVSGPQSLRDHWLYGARVVGVTAGTSTLNQSVEAVMRRLEELGGWRRGSGGSRTMVQAQAVGAGQGKS